MRRSKFDRKQNFLFMNGRATCGQWHTLISRSWKFCLPAMKWQKRIASTRKKLYKLLNSWVMTIPRLLHIAKWLMFINPTDGQTKRSGFANKRASRLQMAGRHALQAPNDEKRLTTSCRSAGLRFQSENRCKSSRFRFRSRSSTRPGGLPHPARIACSPALYSRAVQRMAPAQQRLRRGGTLAT